MEAMFNMQLHMVEVFLSNDERIKLEEFFKCRPDFYESEDQFQALIQQIQHNFQKGDQTGIWLTEEEFDFLEGILINHI